MTQDPQYEHLSFSVCGSHFPQHQAVRWAAPECPSTTFSNLLLLVFVVVVSLFCFVLGETLFSFTEKL